MLSNTSDGFVGLLVTMLGLMVGALFVLADVIGVGTNNYFGPLQIIGTALGALIIVGGVWVCVRSRRDESRLSYVASRSDIALPNCWGQAKIGSTS